MAEKINSFDIMLGISRIHRKTPNNSIYKLEICRLLLQVSRNANLTGSAMLLHVIVIQNFRAIWASEAARSHGHVKADRPLLSYLQYKARLITPDAKDLTAKQIVEMASNAKTWEKKSCRHWQIN